MLEYIKEFTIRLKDSNFRMLWLEQLLFSVLLGAAFHSWLLFAGLFVCLNWVLKKDKGSLYMVCVLSFMWGLVGAVIAYSVSGWECAVAWGMFIFISSIGVHFRDLKKAMNSCYPASEKKKIEWAKDVYWNRLNLN